MAGVRVTFFRSEQVLPEWVIWTGEFLTDEPVTAFSLRAVRPELPDIPVIITSIERGDDGFFRGTFECLQQGMPWP